MEKTPSPFVAVEVLVPFTVTVTPGSASVELSRVTLPVTVRWAIVVKKQKNRNSNRENLLFI
jgi:hypothetical protein